MFLRSAASAAECMGTEWLRACVWARPLSVPVLNGARQNHRGWSPENCGALRLRCSEVNPCCDDALVLAVKSTHQPSNVGGIAKRFEPAIVVGLVLSFVSYLQCWHWHSTTSDCYQHYLHYLSPTWDLDRFGSFKYLRFRFILGMIFSQIHSSSMGGNQP